MHLPEGTQRFLRRTAVLDQLCAPLCDALLDESGAQEQLRSLEASNLFLIPLDRRREWYRYHALFREFLLGELRRVEPDVITKLHLRAADWYEANGSPALALEHLLNTTERDRCVQLVTRVDPADLPGRPHVDGAAVALGARRRRDRGLPPAGRAGRLDRGVHRADRRGATLGGDHRRRLVRPGAAGRHGVVRLGAGHVAGHDVPRRSASRCCPTPASRWPRSRRGARGGTRRSCCAARRICSPATSTGPPCLFAESSALAPRCPTPTPSSSASPSSRCWRWIAGTGRRRPSTCDRALAAIDEHRMHDYAISLLAFAAAARLACTAATEGGGPPAHPGDAGPSVLHVRAAVASPCGSDCSWPRCTGPSPTRPTARHLLREIDDILLHRPDLGALVDEVSAIPPDRHLERAVGTTGGSPLSPAELRLLPYLQTHLTIREIGERLFVSRNTVNSEVGSIYRKLGVSSRSDAVQQATAIGLLGG